MHRATGLPRHKDTEPEERRAEVSPNKRCRLGSGSSVLDESLAWLKILGVHDLSNLRPYPAPANFWHPSHRPLIQMPTRNGPRYVQSTIALWDLPSKCLGPNLASLLRSEMSNLVKET